MEKTIRNIVKNVWLYGQYSIHCHYDDEFNIFIFEIKHHQNGLIDKMFNSLKSSIKYLDSLEKEEA